MAATRARARGMCDRAIAATYRSRNTIDSRVCSFLLFAAVVPRAPQKHIIFKCINLDILYFILFIYLLVYIFHLIL